MSGSIVVIEFVKGEKMSYIQLLPRIGAQEWSEQKG